MQVHNVEAARFVHFGQSAHGGSSAVDCEFGPDVGGGEDRVEILVGVHDIGLQLDGRLASLFLLLDKVSEIRPVLFLSQNLVDVTLRDLNAVASPSVYDFFDLDVGGVGVIVVAIRFRVGLLDLRERLRQVAQKVFPCRFAERE